MDYDIANFAAKWWVEQLKHGGTDNGDNSETGGMTAMLGFLAQDSAREHNTPDKLDKFEELLTEGLQKVDRKWYYIGTDYGPDSDLSKPAEQAGLKCSAFPWKTVMWISEGEITVSAGYRAPIYVIWKEGPVKPYLKVFQEA